jgi:hypothetical protein
MKRFVVVLTVWAMGLAGGLAGVVFPGSASAAAIVGGFTSLASTPVGGAPTWWNGDCDANHWNSVAAAKGWRGAGAHRLGAEYLGVPVCGPRPSVDGAPDVIWSKSGWGHYEWECTELAFRFMAQIYGASSYGANGNTVVQNYTSAAGGGLVRIGNGTAGQAPLPGDVISFSSPTSSFGHVAVVASSSVDGNGNGSVTMLSQNDTSNGWRTLSVSGWKLQSTGTQAPNGWLHDPAGRGNPSGNPIGWISGGFTGQTPTRVLNTVAGIGAAKAKLGAARTLTLTVPGLPAGTTAVAINVTVAHPTAASYLSVYPGGTARPGTSNLNFVAGQTIPNLVMVPLGPGNTITFYNAAGTVNVLGDLVGDYK